MKGELDLCNYATRADLKTATGVDTSKFAKKVDLANLKSNVDKLNIPTNSSNLKGKYINYNVNKLVPVPVDLSKLIDEVKNDVLKKGICNAKIKNIEDKISDITNLATNAFFNAKINEVKGEIPSITNLPTTAALTTVENKIPNWDTSVSSFKLWWCCAQGLFWSQIQMTTGGLNYESLAYGLWHIFCLMA